MSVANAIENLQSRVQAAYTALANKGATVPSDDSQKTTANLPTAINTITELKGETKTVAPTKQQQVITPSNGKNGITQVTVNAVTSDIDSNIQSQNIKSGVSILGVNGSLVPGITPSGNININNTNQTDVTNYATAQVVDSNLIAGNIKKDVSILGISGSYEGGSPVPISENGYTVTVQAYPSDKSYYHNIICHKKDGTTVILHNNGDTCSNVIYIERGPVTTYINDYGSSSSNFNHYIVLTENLTLSIDYGCLLKGTKINLFNNSTKLIENITYNDEILCWNFDECKYTSTRPFWIKKAQKNIFYWVNKFESGLEIKTTGTVAGHRFFNMDKNKFLYNTECVGDYCYTLNGKDKLLEAKYVEDECIFYNVYTHYHMNLFANNILTGFRYNNLYPIKDMKFIKDNRKLRNRLEFQNIPDSWYYGMRCSEQTDSVQNIEDYVNQREIIKMVK